MRPSLRTFKAFSLAELLIAVAIIGVIATFTAPKILGMNKSGDKYNRIANDAAYMIYSAYQMAKMEGALTTNTRTRDLTPYMNYVSYVNTASQSTDDVQGSGTMDCANGGWVCLQLHNGAMLHYHYDMNFGGSATTNAVFFNVDPDGKVTDGTTNGPGKAVRLYLYYDGTIRNYGNARTNTIVWFCCGSSGLDSAQPTKEPPWFSWQ